MLKLISMILIACFSVGALAQSEEMRVMIIDENIKPKHFPTSVKFDSRQGKQSVSTFDRDVKLEKLKLSVYVEKLKMDQLDRDLLYMNLKNNSIQELKITYPQIPAKDLEYAKTNFNL